MSLSNLGKSLKDAGNIFEIYNIAQSHLDDADVLVAAADAMKSAFDKMDSGTAIKAFQKLGVDGDVLRDVLFKCGMETKDIDEKLSKLGTTGDKSTGKLKTAFEGFASSINLTSGQLIGLIGVVTAVVAAFAIWKNYTEQMEQYLLNSVNAATEAGDAWKESKDALDSQVARIEELDKKLQEGSLTEEEAYGVKSELYSIQQDLVSAYGDQASAIDLVNGKLSEEIEKVKALSAAEAQRILNEKYVGFNEATSQMNEQRHLEIGTIDVISQSSSDAAMLDQILDKYEEYIDYIDTVGEYGITRTVYFKGDASEAKEVLNDLSTELDSASDKFQDSSIVDSFRQGISDQLTVVNEVLSTYQEAAEYQKQLTLMADTTKYDFGAESKTAAAWLADFESAVNDYNTALASGDTEKITEAATEFDRVKNAVESATDAAGENDLSQYSEQIEDIANGLNEAAIAANDFKSALSDSSSLEGNKKNISTYANAIKDLNLNDIDLLSSLNTEGMQAGEYSFRKLIEFAQEFGIIADDSTGEVQKLVDMLVDLGYISGNVSDTIQDSAENATKSYTDMATAVSDLKSELSTLNSVVSEQGYSGNISPETYDALIAKSADYAACIEYQNGALQLNTEKANKLFEAKSELQIAELELQKVAEATKWKENAKAIENLESQYDDLTEAQLDELKTLKDERSKIQANLKGYDIQIAALEELTSAYGRWKAVSESDNSDSMYKDIQSAYEQIKEAQKTGQTGVGNIVYQAAVELLIPDEQDVSKYMSTLKRYITEDSSGLSNFINDMVTNGLMDQTGAEVKMKMGVTMEQICEQMKITPDMAKAIFNALEMYDFDFDWTEEDFNFDIDTSEIDAEIAALEARIAEIKADATVELRPGESLESLQTSLDEAYAKKQAVLSGDTTSSGENDITYTVNANTEAADTALENIQSKLDEIAGRIYEVAQMAIGDLGGSVAIEILRQVYDKLVSINNYKIADKSYTVTQYEKTVKFNSSSADGEASATGTNYARGGKTLMGELGRELVVSDGKYYTVGDRGAEFVELKPGDIVFNNVDTEKILSGKSNSGGKTVGGPAMAMVPRIEPDENVSLGSIVGKRYEVEVEVSGGGSTTSLDKNSSTGSGSGSSSRSSSSSSSSGDSSSSSTKEKSQFEKDYEYHRHLLEMEQEDQENYLKWLEDAYQDAYNNGDIELEDFYKYEEEVFNLKKDLFMDGLNDIEHKIEVLGRQDGNTGQIINLYNQMIVDIKKEIAAARARGLDENDDYIQELQEQLWDYEDEIADIQEDVTDDAKSAVEDLIDYRIDMLKQDLENERDALNDKKDALKDFYDDQKEMLQDYYDEEKYIEEQSEKRKAKSDIEAELEQLRFDDSAWAQKRKLELQEELASADKDLSDFEKDHTLESTQDMLDKMYEQQASQIESEIDAIEAKLNDPEALYNQALRDIQNNTQALYAEMVEYNNKFGSGNSEDIREMWTEAKDSLDNFLATFGQAYKDIILVSAPRTSSSTGYASGTKHATPGVHELFERDRDEYVYTTSDGRKYRMFSGLGDKVLNADATNFLYDFATSGGGVLSNMFSNLLNAVNLSKIGKQSQPIQLSTGDVIIQGNASEKTVSEIRRAQREGIDYVLKQFTRLNK